MLFKKWTVMEDVNGHHSYFYGDLDDYEPEELEGYIKVPEEKYTADDISELLGNVLEDNNYHGMTSIGNQVLSSLRKTTSLSEKELSAFMVDFAKSFTEYHCLS